MRACFIPRPQSITSMFFESLSTPSPLEILSALDRFRPGRAPYTLSRFDFCVFPPFLVRFFNTSNLVLVPFLFLTDSLIVERAGIQSLCDTSNPLSLSAVSLFLHSAVIFFYLSFFPLFSHYSSFHFLPASVDSRGAPLKIS